MKHKFRFSLALVAATACASLLISEATAQCSTCADPVVAYQPVTPVAVTTTTASTGWYPGRMFDQWRMRRWSARQAVPTATYTTAAYAPYTASYAPTAYSASYAPTVYSASYAPTSYSASYAPKSYVTAYAPLQRQVSYYRPVALSPVVADTGCSTCGAPACVGCSSGVGQASYDAPIGDCPGCAASASAPNYQPSSQYGDSYQDSAQPLTPQPTLEPTPAESYYRGDRRDSRDYASADQSKEIEQLQKRLDQMELDRIEMKARLEQQELERLERANDPEPNYPEPEKAAGDATGETGAYPWAPQLTSPVNDRTANRPTVDVWNAVYRRPANASQVSVRHETRKPATVSPRTQAEIDAAGWTAVPRSR